MYYPGPPHIAPQSVISSHDTRLKQLDGDSPFDFKRTFERLSLSESIPSTYVYTIYPSIRYTAAVPCPEYDVLKLYVRIARLQGRHFSFVEVRRPCRVGLPGIHVYHTRPTPQPSQLSQGSISNVLITAENTLRTTAVHHDTATACCRCCCCRCCYTAAAAARCSNKNQLITYQNAGALTLSASAIAFSLAGSTTDVRNVPGLDMMPSALIQPIRPAPTTHTPLRVSTGRNGGATTAREEELGVADDDDRTRRLLLLLLQQQFLKKDGACVASGGDAMEARPPTRTRRAITSSSAIVVLVLPLAMAVRCCCCCALCLSVGSLGL